MDKFTMAYIECALWSSTDESDPNTGGNPLDENYSIDDLAPECLAQIEADCKAFQESFGDFISLGNPGGDYCETARAGHDFWLTRNGHGAGFWDGDWDMDIPGDLCVGFHESAKRYKNVGEYLTAMSKPYGGVDLYVGDDGKIYC